MAQTGSLVLNSADVEGTVAFGRCLAQELFPGAVVALIGPLGAGKTLLVRAVAEGLGVVDARVVSSPTFVLIQEYAGHIPIYHFDAYRLKSPADFFDLGTDEYFEGSGVCLVEWADRVAAYLPIEHLAITIQVTGETTRTLEVIGFGQKYAALVQRLDSGQE